MAKIVFPTRLDYIRHEWALDRENLEWSFQRGSSAIYRGLWYGLFVAIDLSGICRQALFELGYSEQDRGYIRKI